MSDDLQGRIALITGANSGLGMEAASALADRGARVLLACRSTARGEAAREALLARHPGAALSVVPLDVTDPASVRSMAETVRREHGALHVLINNAGIQSQQRQLTPAGVERVFATNVLGYFLVAAALEPLLRESAPARLVNVASSFAGDLDLDDLYFERRRYKATAAYRQSKACNRMLTWAHARRLEGSGVTANASAPGMVLSTNIYADVPAVQKAVLKVVNRFVGQQTPAQGADTTAWLASSPEVAGITGGLFEERQRIPCEFADPVAEEQLWGICESLRARS